MKYCILFLGLMVLGGCAKAAHLSELLTLKGVADEQTQIAQYVEQQDRRFDLMVEEAKAGTLDSYENKRKVLRAFGDPVYVREAGEGDQELESWLYRYATQFFDADKIYLYFDTDGHLVKSEYQEYNDGKVR